MTARPGRRPLASRSEGSASSMTLPKRSACRTCVTSPSVGDLRARQHRAARARWVRAARPRPPASYARARGAPRRARTGRVRESSPRSGRARAASADDRPPRRHRRSARRRATAARCRARRACGPRRRSAARPRAAPIRRPGRRPRGARPAGMYSSARRSTSAPERTSWRAMPCVMSMTLTSGAIRAITPWQTPTNSSSSP